MFFHLLLLFSVFRWVGETICALNGDTVEATEHHSVAPNAPVGINSSVGELIPNFFFYAHMLRGGQVLLNYFVLFLFVLVWFFFFSCFLLTCSLKR